MNPAVQVNGRSRDLGEVGGHVTLLEWLRAGGWTGTKEGCAEGECGACAVLVARDDGAGGTRWVAINSCLPPAAAFDQQEVITAEGLGQPGDLHPVQQEMARRGGSQCGYCTPGFICSMAAEYYRPDRMSARNGHSDHEHGPNGFDLHALSGNLCRCTGYRPIRDSAFALGAPDPADPLAARQTAPPPAAAKTSVTSDQGRYVRPGTLAETLDLLAGHPDAQLVAGSTDWGVELNIRHHRAGLSIGIDRLPELREFTVGPDHFGIGAALSLSEAEANLAGQIPLLDALFPQFASRLIRNGATFGGNLGTASPIGDTAPVLLALGASLVLSSAAGDREVPLADYFTGYRQSVRQPGELIRAIRIPRPLAPVTGFHKIAKRRFDDISSVAVAYALTLTADETVAEARIGLGGVAATPLRARDAEQVLTGQPWTRATIKEAADALARAGTPMSDHRASAEYRTAMLRTSLLKFFAEHTGHPGRPVPEGEPTP
jgi:xanthine dehydrogenase small subunit